MEQEEREEQRKKSQEFTKRMLPAMLAIAGFMIFYFIYGGFYERSIDNLMVAMIISTAIASFIARAFKILCQANF
ncbi:hypothetical protein HRJ35_01585 [Shewanella oneidensis MR-1]|uniref:hypothetical protein n=1 Tax=Shewanella oneidensis TaxID=70863 RepID=UPI0013E89A8D|nr:hypothetical protein [Shewanella oneidensis]MDX5998206.1 hypothetical protein [Shewanella oneidensis]MEE2030464.1 hypothetical protein [Shewanella oneidensis]QKG94806.1 hypothetical protein HRJ35_01585 [Shewanella oneidensis MR-1]